jgi:ATP synthase protein I
VSQALTTCDDLMQQPDARQAKKILYFQSILGVVSVVTALPFGLSVAISVLIGVGVCVLANAMLAAWIFRHYRAQRPERLVARFYVAETAKIALTVGLLVVAFVTLDDLIPAVSLAAYLVVQVIPTLIAAQLGSR